MIDSNKDLVASLEQKIDLLVSRYSSQKEQLEMLFNEKRQLADQLKNSVEQFTELQVRYDNLKMAKTLELSQGDAHEAKLKINQMVREIDKCISLLNR